MWFFLGVAAIITAALLIRSSSLFVKEFSCSPNQRSSKGKDEPHIYPPYD